MLSSKAKIQEITTKSKLKYLAASILAVLLTSGTAFASLTSESRAGLSQLKSQNQLPPKYHRERWPCLSSQVSSRQGLFLARKAAKASCSFMENGGALPDTSSLLWLASRCSEIRLRALFH